MSKKIAAGAQAIVLDVKIGVGAFVKNLDEARELGTLMVDIAKLAGRSAVALLSDMNQPLGYAVGNALELKEAIETLHGSGPKDFKEHCRETACHMLTLGGVTDSVKAARPLVETAFADGSAWEHFRKLVAAQGGDVAYIDDPSKLPTAPFIETIISPRTCYLRELNARTVGESSVALGAGRATKVDAIDHAVGIVIQHKVGDKVETGQPLFTIHANDRDKLALACDRVLAAHLWSDQPVESLPLFYGVIR